MQCTNGQALSGGLLLMMVGGSSAYLRARA
jgi:hypothetical protein